MSPLASLSPRPGRILAAALLAAALVFGPGAARAQGELEWVEVDAVLDASGVAEVTYQARWRTPGTLHGFYFQGETAAPEFTGGTAELPDGSVAPLSITPAGADRWDVVLAEGRAWGPGEATYRFSYRADLAAAGLVAPTRGPGGEDLVVFNWSPVAWDEPLAHETLTVTFPSVPAPRSGELGLEGAAALGLRTEPWVNERYLITYSGAGEPPALSIRFHRNDVPA